MFFLKKQFLLVTVFLFLFPFLSAEATSSLDITIIEIGAYKSNGYEYIKIHNNTSQNISLENWKFKEGFSDSKPNGIKHSLHEYSGQGYLLLAQQNGIIAQNPDNFLSENNFSGLILDSSWGSLKEDGEKIELLNEEGKIIESFTYLPCSDNPLQRRDYSLDDYSANNWQCAKNNDDNYKKENSSPQNRQNNQELPYVSPDKSTLDKNIIINEIYPNPPGADTKEEFIELKNKGNTTICLNHWSLEDKEGSRYTIFHQHFQQSFILPHHFYTIKRAQSKIALNNFGGESIKLYNDQNELIDQVSYVQQVPPSFSYSKNNSEEWSWTPSPTPNQQNKITPLNHPPHGVVEPFPKKILPQAPVIFDASDSYDPDGDDIYFIWKFGDNSSSTLVNPTHTYKQTGDYQIKLYLFDDKDASSTLSFSVKVEKPSTNPSPPSQTSFSFKKNSSSSYVIINEIYPAPLSSQEEFIELFNPRELSADISNWQMKDKSGHSFSFSSPTILPPFGYLTFYKQQTHLSLNNKEDSLTLFDSQQHPVFQLSYHRAPKLQSYCFFSEQKKWDWSASPTPGEANILIKKNNNHQSSLYLEQSRLSTNTSSSSLSFADEYNPLPLSQLFLLSSPAKITTTGTVVALPQTFGKNFFYINGLQIYLEQGDFPNLALGDKIKVSGSYSFRYEPKINIFPSDIKLLKHQNPPLPQVISLDQINKKWLGYLIQIEGEITEKKSSYFWVDDNKGEIKVFLGSSIIPRPKLNTQEKIIVAGILRQNKKKNFFLAPRSLGDLNFSKKMLISNSQVKGEKVSSSSSWFYYIPQNLIVSLPLLLHLKNKFTKKE